jgi:hypothetical protein
MSDTVECEHWTKGKVVGGGVCADGRFGGRPSLGTCDKCKGLPVRAPSPELVQLLTANDLRATEGPKRWAELHRRASSGVIAEDEREFIRTLAKGLGRCKCATEWAMLLVRMPPDLSSPAAYEAWAIAAHDKINANLGKPLYSARINVPL